MSEGNLETIFCAEVIRDEVQLWNRKQVTRVKLSDRGNNMTRTWKHNKESENKNNQNIKRDKLNSNCLELD